MTQTTFSEEEIELYRNVPLHNVVGIGRVNKKVKIVCPFHNEKTGSCQLFPTGGFHCFGCGANGNSIDFLMKLGATYNEAVEELRKYI